MSEQQKRLIVLCDGTWNNPEQKSVTNVVKMARAILAVDRQGLHQVVFYDWGGGSEELDDRLSGGIAGLGLDKNIQDVYRFLVHNYAKGDEIFLFGFSRGAYTARSAAGLIRNAGILKKQYAKLIPAASLSINFLPLSAHLYGTAKAQRTLRVFLFFQIGMRVN